MYERQTPYGMIVALLCGAFIFITSACSGSPAAEFALPTVAVLPSASPTDEPTVIAQAITEERPTLPATWTPTPTATHTPIPTDTPTPTETVTPSPTITDTATPEVSATPDWTPTPIGDAAVTGEFGVNLREGPSTAFDPPIVLLDPLTELKITGQSSDGRWYEVDTFDGQSGWVSARLVEPRIDMVAVQVTWVITPEPTVPPEVIVVDLPDNNVAGPVAVVGSNAGAYNVDGAPSPAQVAAEVPGLVISNRVRQIYRSGQQRGNRPNLFSKVGDSITHHRLFMAGYGDNAYNLGPYGYLQGTIDFYLGGSPRAGIPNSFVNPSFAASNGGNAASVLASMWSDEQFCQPNETPLDCEYRIVRPAVSVILLGAIDVTLYDAADYEQYLSRVVTKTINAGVIPVLTTFQTHPNYHPNSEQFNQVIRGVAAREQIPLVDLRVALANHPNYGVRDDGYHPSHNGDIFINLNDKNEFGVPMHNLLILQTLDVIRRSVMQ